MKYQIKSNLPISGSHWGLLFRDGVAVTEKRGLADKLKERGYEVVEIVDKTIFVAAPAKSEAVEAVESVEIAEPLTAESEPEPEPQKFTCSKCGKQYMSASALKRHFDKCEAE